jgi:beta-galactosidase
MTDTIFHLDRRGLIQAGLAGTLAASPAMAMAAGKAPAPASPRRTLRLSDGWRFHLGHASDIARDFGYGRNQRTFAKAGTGTADAAMPAFKDEDWQDVRVPHDWAVDLPYAPPLTPAGKDDEDAVAAHGFRAIGRAFPENSVGWYRRVLPVSAADKGRSVWLEFDGVMRDSVVFINGYIVGAVPAAMRPSASILPISWTMMADPMCWPCAWTPRWARGGITRARAFTAMSRWSAQRRPMCRNGVSACAARSRA